MHILADTLGSVGVIVSALLMQYFGWMIADPICSMIIAILIFISVGSLLKESTAILMQRQPKELDHKLPECYNKVCTIFEKYLSKALIKQEDPNICWDVLKITIFRIVAFYLGFIREEEFSALPSKKVANEKTIGINFKKTNF